jgi:bifunctional oligoribonuclease and PAP phosphatase NrnA
MKIVIITHVNPDGDAIGSSLGLYNVLVQEKHRVTVITPNEYPSFLAWMPACNRILVDEMDHAKVSQVLADAELIFCLDFNGLNRMAGIGEAYTRSKAIKILIDHHLEPSHFTDHSISIAETSSTSELIYDLVVELGKKHLINKAVAECLYVGIATDTGSFSYACNHAKTFEITAELIKLGIDGEHIHRLVYDTYSEDRMRLLGYCLSEKLKVLPQYKTAYISLTKEDLAKFNYKVGDTEGVVNYALSIDGVTMAALFMERDENIKVSMRSKGNASVNDICRKYYEGGGHHNAAGGNSYVSMVETLAVFEKLLPVIMPLN